MKCSHRFSAAGTCTACGKRKPGRPRKAILSQPAKSGPSTAGTEPIEALPAAPPAGSAGQPSTARDIPDRVARLRQMFAPPPPVVAAPPAEPEPEPEPEPERTIALDRYDWQWAASTATEGTDVGSGWLIERWSNLQPLEASESSRKKFSATLAKFGEQRLGKVEVPTWIVLLICLVAMVLSKVIGAPAKRDRVAAEALLKASLAKSARPGSAPAAASAGPDVASGAGSVATPAQPPQVSMPSTPIASQITGAGSAEGAPNGF